LNVSRDGASTASLGNPFQCFTTLIVKNFFLISSLNLPCFSLKPLPLILSLLSLLKRLSPSFHPPVPPSPSQQSCSQSPHPRACIDSGGCPNPDARTLHLALLNFMRFTQAHFSSLPRSLWTYFKSIFLQFRENDVVRDCVKGFTEVQTDHIHSSSPVHWSSHAIIESH